jgi:hypothetical protein
MKSVVIDHQGKGKALQDALANVDNGWYLIDSDNGDDAALIRGAKREGYKVALYSHGAPVMLQYDGILKPSPDVDLYLAQSEGQKEVMLKFGYPIPIKIIGWHYCEQKDFKPVREIKKVLYAPWHPDSRGIIPEAKAANIETLMKLSKGKYKLTVRYARSLDGMPILDGVSYHQSDYTIESSIREIEKADVVVANCSTFACLAIALGKPTVMYGQHIQGRPTDRGVKPYSNWDKYKDLLWYANNMDDYYLENAMFEDKWWRNMFIGKPFTKENLMEALG